MEQYFRAHALFATIEDVKPASLEVALCSTYRHLAAWLIDRKITYYTSFRGRMKFRIDDRHWRTYAKATD
jgi:hypothetical protein